MSGKRRFAGSVKGNGKTEASRYDNVINGHIRGWDLGLGIDAYVNDEGSDAFDIHLTGGSNSPKEWRDILTIEQDPNGAVRVVVHRMGTDDGYAAYESEVFYVRNGQADSNR